MTTGTCLGIIGHVKTITKGEEIISTYCYTLRKATKNVNVDGKFQALPQFKFAYGNAGNGRDALSRDRQLTASCKAFDRFEKDGLVLALDGEYVVLTKRTAYVDDKSREELHTIIGRVKKVGNRLYCVAQNTTEELARNSVAKVYS